MRTAKNMFTMQQISAFALTLAYCVIMKDLNIQAGTIIRTIMLLISAGSKYAVMKHFSYFIGNVTDAISFTFRKHFSQTIHRPVIEYFIP